jgi:hypothetical protein
VQLQHNNQDGQLKLPRQLSFELPNGRILTVPINQVVQVKDSEICFAGSEEAKVLVQDALKQLRPFFAERPASFDVIFVRQPSELETIGAGDTNMLLVGAEDATANLPPGAQFCIMGDQGGVNIVTYVAKDRLKSCCNSTYDLSADDYRAGFVQEIAHAYHHSVFGLGGPFWLVEGVGNGAAGNFRDCDRRVDFRWIERLNQMQDCNPDQESAIYWCAAASNFIRNLVECYGRERLFSFLEKVGKRGTIGPVDKEFGEVYGFALEDAVTAWQQESEK